MESAQRKPCFISLYWGMCKAYIPLRCKTIQVGYWRWLGPPTPHFCVTYTNMLVSKKAENLRYPQRKFYNLHHPTQNPNANQWNIGCKIRALGMYISCCLCQFHLHWVANANAFFSGIWALVLALGSCWVHVGSRQIAN